MMKIKYLKNEKGVALVTSIMLLSLLTIIGFSSMNSSDIELKIAGNERASTQTFYLAEAGIEHAWAKLHQDAIASGDGNFSSFIGFNGVYFLDDTNAEYSLDGNGKYKVNLTHSNNNNITLKSEGFDIGNANSVVEVKIQIPTIPNFNGAIVLPGPDVIFHGGNSNASGVDGASASAVSLSSDDAELTVIANLTAIGRINNYVCDGTAGTDCINNDTGNMDPRLEDSGGLRNIVDDMSKYADLVITSSTTTTLTNTQVGTIANPQIVKVNGDAVLGPVAGSGILIVTGTLTLHGNFNYNGIILVVGEGKLTRSGAGNGTINGSIIVAKTIDADGNDLDDDVLGIPYYDTSGGGNSDINYDPDLVESLINNKFPPKLSLVSWKQL